MTCIGSVIWHLIEKLKFFFKHSRINSLTEYDIGYLRLQLSAIVSTILIWQTARAWRTVHRAVHAMATHVPVSQSLPLSVILRMAQLEAYCWLSKIAMAKLVLKSVDPSRQGLSFSFNQSAVTYGLCRKEIKLEISVLMRPTVRLIITGSMFIRMRQSVMQTAR